jgi:hypothetical protein
MESWRSYLAPSDPVKLLLEEKGALEQFKDSPKHAEDLLKQMSQIKDEKQLANIAQVLLKDPEIKAAADVIVSAAEETKKQAKSVEEIQQVGDFVKDAGAHAAVGIKDILTHPKVKGVLRYGAPVVILGAIAAMISPIFGGPDGGQMAPYLFSLADAMSSCSTADPVDCMAAVVAAAAGDAAGSEYTPPATATEQE